MARWDSVSSDWWIKLDARSKQRGKVSADGQLLLIVTAVVNNLCIHIYMHTSRSSPNDTWV